MNLYKINKLFIIIICILFLLLLFSNKKQLFTVGAESSYRNIYGDPLEKCRTGTDNGSWDPDGYCSEEGGGVHQICFDVTTKRKNFSTVTGQTDWSTERVGNNHCMCLGAWALYKAKGEGDGNELVCEAIPEMALDPTYIDNWNTWNGKELDDQIIDGVNSLVEQCYKNQSNIDKKNYLKEKYDNLRSNYTDSDWNSIISD